MIIAMFSTCVMAEKTGESKEIQIQEAVNAVVASYSKETNNTAILLLLAKDGKSYQAAAGLADRAHGRQVKSDDLFEIGSATKVFTGISILQLIESGKLSLDTKLKTFYPQGKITQLANYKGKNYWEDVTVGMLLQHTSGFIDYFNVYGDDSKALKILGGKEKHFTFPNSSTFPSLLEMPILSPESSSSTVIPATSYWVTSSVKYRVWTGMTICSNIF